MGRPDSNDERCVRRRRNTCIAWVCSTKKTSTGPPQLRALSFVPAAGATRIVSGPASKTTRVAQRFRSSAAPEPWRPKGSRISDRLPHLGDTRRGGGLSATTQQLQDRTLASTCRGNLMGDAALPRLRRHAESALGRALPGCHWPLWNMNAEPTLNVWFGGFDLRGDS